MLSIPSRGLVSLMRSHHLLFNHRPSTPKFQFSSQSTARAARLPPGASQGNGRSGGGGRTPIYLWAAAGIPTGTVIFLYYKYLDEVPMTGRKRWIATSPQWERQLGDQEYQQLLQQFHGNILPNDHRASVTVQRVGKRIADAAQVFCQDHQLNYISSTPTFTVVRADMANAFVLPNNHIFVFTGMFEFARDEDELASVLAHEMAHNLARHVGEKISGNFVVQLLARVSLLIDPSGLLLTVFLPTASLLRELPHSRLQELEADQIGIRLAAQACYNPNAAKRVFQRMQKAAENNAVKANGSGEPPAFLSTHPSHSQRIQKFDEWMPEALKVFEGGVGDGTGHSRCSHIRHEMTAARQVAAQQAVRRELLLLPNSTKRKPHDEH